MANTLADARISGLRAAMEPADPREVPAQFARNETLAAAWLEAYDGIAVSMLNQRYGVMEAPAKAERSTDAGERKPRQKALKTAATAPSAPKPKPTMKAIVDALEGEFAE
jgi:hypothetical protein